jgi:hypothetical protein
MPRPKRAKVASKTARVATANPAPRKQQSTKATKASVESLDSNEISNNRSVVVATKPDAFPVSEALSFSDDSDGLVVKSTRQQRRMPWQPEAQEDVDYTMTGALPMNDKMGVSSPKNRTPLPNASRRARTSKGSAAASFTKKTPTSLDSRHSRSLLANTQDAGAEEEDSSGFGDHLLSFTSIDSNSPAHGTRPPSAIKVGATPAHETSILALTNFKRRPRQHSLLRAVQQTADVDVDDDDLDDFNFDDFLPDAESTPLQVQKSAPGEPVANDSGVNLSSSGSRGIKRKFSPVIQVPRSSPPYESGSNLEESRSPSPSLPEIVQSTEEAQAISNRIERDVHSETMAPPMSSSDVEDDEIEVPIESPVGRRQQRKRGTTAKPVIDSESEGDLTDRPKRAKGKQKSKANRGISTAKLQALLPRRRVQIPQEEEDEFGIPSENDSDQDELALPQRRQAVATRKPTTSKTAKKPRAAKKTTGKPTQKNTRTYGRRASSDKENEEDHEQDNSDEDDTGTTSKITTAKPSKGLEAIARKFEEVDDFELDFESVSYVQTSSPAP